MTICFHKGGKLIPLFDGTHIAQAFQTEVFQNFFWPIWIGGVNAILLGGAEALGIKNIQAINNRINILWRF
ncbi:hypothetical protein A7P95_06355 [Eikenella longinqua]|uniref:Uncharacterized protein n=1 Tax=Eikenella longinqua TaxID=1795827 RepID=A0A1A9RXX7_9NEIS|nr:hypothetical protein A7P95_06355 [Eikenella longinqua]